MIDIPAGHEGCNRLKAVAEEAITGVPDRLSEQYGKQVVAVTRRADVVGGPPQLVVFLDGTSASDEAVNLAWQLAQDQIRERDQRVRDMIAACPGMCLAKVVHNDEPVDVRLCGIDMLDALRAAIAES